MTHDVGIYAITNKVNGHKYIGSACSLRAREGQHFRSLARGRHHSVYLQRAFDKYGSDAFNFAPIIYCGRENLLTYEQAAMDAMKPEYNIAQVAGSQLGYKHTAESRKRMSIARRRNPSSPRKGMTHTDEAKRKISDSRKGKGGGRRSPERLAKISAALIGRPVSQETRSKISESLKGRSTGRGLLSDSQVREIRALHESGMSVPDIGRKIGIPRQNVRVVTNGFGYRWVS